MATSTVAGNAPKRRVWLGLASTAMAVASASAQNLVPFPTEGVPDWQQDSVMRIQINAPNGGIPLTYVVVPFTNGAGLNLSDTKRGPVRIEGSMVVATESTYNDIKWLGSVAYLSCDGSNTSANSPATMLNKLIDSTPNAIVLYSQSSCCGIRGIDESLKFPYLYTMTDAAEASEVFNVTTVSSGVVQASIFTNGTSQENSNQSGNNSAVAMSILYSITGLITLLFLVIIGTGAIRAHRYPERYGPRGGYGGRPGQSRAKGIARAVLETLPIVKFGGTAPASQKPDPALELDDRPGSRDRGTTPPGADTMQAHHLSTIPEDVEAQHHGTNGPVRESRVNPTPAQPGQGTLTGVGYVEGPKEVERLGCLICIEDFLIGEDVRVLPCDHKFHPACIDPWLVNVSGTCPLCRLDLRPSKAGIDDDDDSISSPLPPPLEVDIDHDGTNQTTASERRGRRSSRLFDISRLRHASAAERIEVLRQYRRESRASDSTADTDEHHRTSRLTNRLKDKFRIRTRAQSPPPRRHNPRRDSDQTG